MSEQREVGGGKRDEKIWGRRGEGTSTYSELAWFKSIHQVEVFPAA